MDDLIKLRNKIDDVDRLLIELFATRLGIVKEIEKIKLSQGLPIRNQVREFEIIEKSIKNIKNIDYADEIKTFMKEIINISIDMQMK